MPRYIYTEDDYTMLRITSTDLVYATEWWREGGRWHMAIHGPKWMLEDIERELAGNAGVMTDMQAEPSRLVVMFAEPGAHTVARKED